jgi:hypothetical protein
LTATETATETAAMRNRFRWTPFVDLSRHRQKDQFIRARNRIRRAAPVLGGRFYTHDYLHGENGWANAIFLSPRPPLFYNALLRTTRYAYREEVENLASDASYELAPDREPDFFSRGRRDPKTKYWVYDYEPLRYPELDGLTRQDWITRELPRFADARTVHVFESWTLHRDYEFGLGLEAVIDVPFLTIEALHGFIDRFLAAETDFRSDTPLSYGYEEAGPWGLESNALIDPWDWPRVKSVTEG